MTKHIILHSTTNWLAQTQTWIYSQIMNTNSDIFESHVSCESTLNLDQFPLENIHVRDNNLSFFRKKVLRLQERLTFFRRLAPVLLVGNKIHPQVIHSHFGNRGWFDMPTVNKLSCKHIVTYYGYDVNQLLLQQPIWLKRYKELFKSADLFLCEGSFMAKSLSDLGCDKDKIIVQHLGVELSKIKYQPRSWKEGDPLKILIAAGFREKKGIPYALKAVATIQDKIPIEVTIIGDAINKPDSIKEKEVILQTIEDLNLNERVTLLGFQSHQVLLKEAYNHHLFLSPSITAKDGDSEGGAPVSIIEMIATGMIVISTSHCDIPEVVNYQIKDWLVNERDIDGLNLRLQWLIDNPFKWLELQESGRRHIEKEYDARTQGDKLSNIYLNLLKYE